MWFSLGLYFGNLPKTSSSRSIWFPLEELPWHDVTSLTSTESAGSGSQACNKYYISTSNAPLHQLILGFFDGSLRYGSIWAENCISHFWSSLLQWEVRLEVPFILAARIQAQAHRVARALTKIRHNVSINVAWFAGKRRPMPASTKFRHHTLRWCKYRWGILFSVHWSGWFLLFRVLWPESFPSPSGIFFVLRTPVLFIF